LGLPEAAVADNRVSSARHTGAAKEGAVEDAPRTLEAEDGLTTVEYALILMLLVVASAASWGSLGYRTSASVGTSAQSLPN